jgi:hypothetical protein
MACLLVDCPHSSVVLPHWLIPHCTEMYHRYKHLTLILVKLIILNVRLSIWLQSSLVPYAGSMVPFVTSQACPPLPTWPASWGPIAGGPPMPHLQVMDFGHLNSGQHPRSRARALVCRGDLQSEGHRCCGELVQLECHHHRGGRVGHTNDLCPRQLMYESNLKLQFLL